MIAALLPRQGTRRASSALLFATIALGGVIACADRDAPAATARSAQKSGAARGGDSTLPVVIARPSSQYQVDAGTAGATVTGTVTAPASLAAGSPAATGRDSSVCGPAMADESVVRQGAGIGGAVVWLDDIRRGKAIPLERRHELESDKCKLTPRVQAGVVGSAVNVLGHDDFTQHLRFVAGGESEPRAAVLLGQYEQVIPTEKPFTAPGLVIVRDVDHAWPAAYVAVFDHPYYAVTAPNGTFTLDGVPPGKYRLKVWHERAGSAERSVDVSATGATVGVELK